MSTDTKYLIYHLVDLVIYFSMNKKINHISIELKLLTTQPALVWKQPRLLIISSTV